MSSLDKLVMQTYCLDGKGYWDKRCLFVLIDDPNWHAKWLNKIKDVSKTYSTTRKVKLS